MKKITICISILILTFHAATVVAGGYMPPADSGRTNPSVTELTIGKTICVSGWTAKIRPPSSYTNGIKKKLMALEGIPQSRMSSYELDHIIPLELGGAPFDPANLWLEPWDTAFDGVDLGAHSKDRVENYLKRQVCKKKMPLAEAQRKIVNEWPSIYKEISNK